MQGATVTLSTTSSGSTINFNGLDQIGLGRSICTTTRNSNTGSSTGKVLTVDKTTSLKFNSASKLTITCERQMSSDGKGGLFADAQTLVFNTSAGSYQVPMVTIGLSPRVTVDQAVATIQSDVNAKLAEISKLSSLVGLIASFNSSSCPAGWKPADGTNGTPDLRGEFIRGLDNGRGVDAGRGLGSIQQHQLQTHTHRVTDGAVQSYNMAVAGGNLYAPVIGAGATTDNYPESTAPHGANVGSETRPRNVALLYCVKN